MPDQFYPGFKVSMFCVDQIIVKLAMENSSRAISHYEAIVNRCMVLHPLINSLKMNPTVVIRCIE